MDFLFFFKLCYSDFGKKNGVRLASIIFVCLGSKNWALGASEFVTNLKSYTRIFYKVGNKILVI